MDITLLGVRAAYDLANHPGWLQDSTEKDHASPHFHLKDHSVKISGYVRHALVQIADKYHQRTHADLTVTDGTRTPRDQAERMYVKLHRGDDLRHLYSNKEALEEILTAYKRASENKSARHMTVDAMTAVIKRQVSGHPPTHISLHLLADAFDVRSNGMSAKQVRIFSEAAEKAGFAVLVESDHLHAQRKVKGG